MNQQQDDTEEIPRFHGWYVWVIMFLLAGAGWYHQRDTERNRVGARWLKRCLGEPTCQTHIVAVSDACYDRWIPKMDPEDELIDRGNANYSACVLEEMRRRGAGVYAPPDLWAEMR